MKAGVLRAASIVLALASSLSAFAADLSIPDAARQRFAAMSSDTNVKKALDFIRQDDARTLADQKELVVYAGRETATSQAFRDQRLRVIARFLTPKAVSQRISSAPIVPSV